MINRYEVYETNQMIAEENLDVRTITLGISLLDCIDADLDKLNENIYNKITTVAKDLAGRFRSRRSTVRCVPKPIGPAGAVSHACPVAVVDIQLY